MSGSAISKILLKSGVSRVLAWMRRAIQARYHVRTLPAPAPAPIEPHQLIWAGEVPPLVWAGGQTWGGASSQIEKSGMSQLQALRATEVPAALHALWIGVPSHPYHFDSPTTRPA